MREPIRFQLEVCHQRSKRLKHDWPEIQPVLMYLILQLIALLRQELQCLLEARKARQIFPGILL